MAQCLVTYNLNAIIAGQTKKTQLAMEKLAKTLVGDLGYRLAAYSSTVTLGGSVTFYYLIIQTGVHKLCQTKHDHRSMFFASQLGDQTLCHSYYRAIREC